MVRIEVESEDKLCRAPTARLRTLACAESNKDMRGATASASPTARLPCSCKTQMCHQQYMHKEG